MHDVFAMRRTSIYLDDDQLESLRGLSNRRSQPVAALVREAIDHWLAAQRRAPEDERHGASPPCSNGERESPTSAASRKTRSIGT
jgi:hypothetical protein